MLYSELRTLQSYVHLISQGVRNCEVLLYYALNKVQINKLFDHNVVCDIAMRYYNVQVTFQ